METNKKKKSLTIIEDHRYLLKIFASPSPWHVLLFTVPSVALLWMFGWDRSTSLWVNARAVLWGVFYWSFLEYAMHRWYYHWTPKNEFLRRFVESFHVYHHRNIMDFAFLNAGPALAFVLTVVFGGPLALVTQDLALSAMIMSGTFIGYYVYEWFHYAVHMYRFETGWLAEMQRFHLYHHLSDWNVCYGVTNPWWDMLFRTAAPGARKKTYGPAFDAKVKRNIRAHGQRVRPGKPEVA